MSTTESDSNGLARRFGDWLRGHMQANDWSNTYVSVMVWGNENGRGRVSGYLNAKRGEPSRLTIMKFCDKLGLPREEGEALLRDAPEPEATPDRNWPRHIPPGIGIDRNVIGREADVATLRANLTETAAAAITPGSSGGAVVRGRGGMGKTTLARFYIQRHRMDYLGIWWLRAQDRSTVVDDLAKLARWVKVADPAADAEANADAALAYLQQQTDPWLLVYDNAEAIGPLRDLLPEQDNIHILLTSREGNWPARFTEQPADALTEDDAIALLYQESGRAGDEDGATALVHALDRLPLAIVAAGAWLRDVSESFAEYQDRLAERIAEKPPGVTDYPDSVFGAIKLSLDRLSPDAALLMKVFCWLAPDDLWPGLLTGLAQRVLSDPIVPEGMLGLARSSTALDRAFADLRDRSLLDREGEDSWRLHRLTQAVQQELSPDHGSTDWRAVAAALLAASLPHNPTLRENWPLCARLDPHVAALADEDPPVTEAMEYLLNQAATYQNVQENEERSLRYLEVSFRQLEARVGEDHRVVGTVCSNLAIAYLKVGRLVEAEANAARAVAIAEDGGGTVAELAIRRSVHGLVLDSSGRTLTGPARDRKLELAKSLFLSALELDMCVHGIESREVATRLHNIADLFAWTGHWDEAIVFYDTALIVSRKAMTTQDPDTGASTSAFGITLSDAGRVRQGHEGLGVLDLLEEALTIYEDAFDRADHQDRVSTARYLASAHWALLDLGPPIRGTVQPDAERAEALCESYGLDLNTIKAQAAVYAARARAHEAGQIIPGEMQVKQERAERIAEKLAGDWSPRAAYETLSGDLALKDMTEAYQVQEVLQRKYAATRGAIAGRKIALSSKAMQEMVGIDQPIAGAIFANDVHQTGAEISLSTFRHLGLEYELAFELSQDVGEPVEAGSVLDLVASVRPAFELIEDKAADYTALDVLTLMADNAWCGGVVLGDPIAGWRDLGLGNLPSVLSQEGVADEAGNTSAADPVNSLVWVLNHFVGRGAVLKAGEVMITGSVLKTRFPVPGDRVRYEITGHAAVEVSLVA